MLDILNQIIGSWAVIEFAYTKKRMGKDSRVRKRYYWKVECTNCRSARTIEESNLKPPAGGRCQNCFDQPKGHAGLVVLLDNYARNAKIRNKEFLLNESQFKNLTSQNCHYCNSQPVLIRRSGKKNAKSHWGDYYFNGLDRIDNKIGYIESNVVPCCIICNRAKKDMKYQDFISWINRIKNSKA
jgi:hypothetical protein